MENIGEYTFLAVLVTAFSAPYILNRIQDWLKGDLDDEDAFEEI